MHLSIADQDCQVYLSSAIFSFERFIDWLKQIDLRLPVRPFYIDEEGPDVNILVLDVEQDDVIGFSVLDMKGLSVRLNGYVDRKQLISSFREALRLFFALGYVDPCEGVEIDSEAFRVSLIEFFGEDGYREMYGDLNFPREGALMPSPSLRERVLSDP